MNYKEFSQRVKQKHPEYADMDDRVLSEKIIKKYPEYQDKVSFDESDEIKIPAPESLGKYEVSSETTLKGKITKEAKTYWDKEGRLHYTNEDEQPKMNWVRRQGRNLKAKIVNSGDWLNNSNFDSDDYKQKANLALTLLTMPMGAGTRFTQFGTNLLKPYVGKTIAKGISQGAGAGLVSGGVYGIGEGLINEKNPIISGTQGAASGLALGGLGGGAFSNAIKMLRGHKLKNLSMLNSGLKKTRKEATNYYKDYIQGTITKRKDLGTIHYTQAGLETVSKQPRAGKYFSELKNDIKSANYIGSEKPTHDRKDGIIVFHRLKRGKKEFLIGERRDGKKYYMSKIMEDATENQPSRVGTVTPSNLILTNSTSNLNPSSAKLAQSVVKGDSPLSVTASLTEKPPQYQKISNAELINNAQNKVSKKFDLIKSNISSKLSDEKYHPNAQDFEDTRQVVTHLLSRGDEVSTAEAINLIETAARKASEAGQAVQALSLWSKISPEGAVLQAQKILQRYAEANPKKQITGLSTRQINRLKYLAQDIQNQTTQRGLEVATAKLLKYQNELVPASFGAKLKAYRNISLLLNPKTLERNIIGNTVFNPLDLVSKTLAAPIDKAASLFSGVRTRTLPHMGAYFKGLGKGIKYGLEDALLGIDTRGMGQRFDLGGRTRVFDSKIGRGFEAALDIGLKVPDRAFYQAAFDESLLNQMKAQGINEATAEMLKIAEQEALEAVFQNNSTLSRAILDVRKGINRFGIKDFGLGDLLIPYAQTPANLAQQGINYSPFGVFKSIGNFASGNQRQASLDLARAITGSGLMYGGAELAKNKLGRGDIESGRGYVADRDLKSNLALLGERPYQLGDYSFSQYQPLSIPLSAGMALAGNKDAISSSVNSLFDLPMLSNYNKLAQDWHNYGGWHAARNFVGNTVSQFAPSMLGFIGNHIDNNLRETYDPNPFIQGLKRAGAKIPGVSMMLPKKYDVMGRESKRYSSEGAKYLYDVYLNPSYVNKKQSIPVINEMKRLYETTGETKQFLPVAEKSVELSFADGRKENKKLSGREYSNYQKILGTANAKYINEFIHSDRYRRMNDEERVEAVQKLQSDINKAVKARMFGSIGLNERKNLSSDEIVRRKINGRFRKYNRIRKIIQNNDMNNFINNIEEEK